MKASQFRFGSAHLFYAITLFAASIALFGTVGLAVASFILLVWWQLILGALREATAEERNEAVLSTLNMDSKARRGGIQIELVVVFLLAALLVGLLTPANFDADPMKHAEISLRMVAKAIKAYEAKHGSLPQLMDTASNTQAMHSWRATILPFLDEDKLTQAYRLQEPWNSAHNASLAQFRPWHFRIYDESHNNQPQDTAGDVTTTVQLIRFENNDWILMSHEELHTHWLKPLCLAQDALELLTEPASHDKGFWLHGFFTSQHRGRLLVSRDACFEVFDSVRPHELEQLSSRVAESSTDERIRLGRPERIIHYDNCLRLMVFFGVALYPIRWLREVRN